MKRVVFLDRDGTLIVEPPDEQIDSLEKLELIPGVIQGLLLLRRHGYHLVMVTNQDRLGSDHYPLASFERVQRKLMRILEGEGIEFAEVLICPHGPDDGCDCRKPRTGLLGEYLADGAIDRARSFVVGDRETDVMLGKAIGCRSIRLGSAADSDADHASDSFLEICRWIARSSRHVRLERNTLETRVVVELTLDGEGRYDVDTGLGFFDHMLAQIARHAMIDLTVHVDGDLHVDEHHTVEDTGIALGEALRAALGDKRGIGRYGFVLPMDDAQSQVALDIGGRPYLRFDAVFDRERVGELPTELVEEFFRAFADGLRANVHIKAEGRNAHHMIESMFKGVARSLRQACARDLEGVDILPSTKGVL